MCFLIKSCADGSSDYTASERSHMAIVSQSVTCFATKNLHLLQKGWSDCNETPLTDDLCSRIAGKATSVFFFLSKKL